MFKLNCISIIIKENKKIKYFLVGISAGVGKNGMCVTIRGFQYDGRRKRNIHHRQPFRVFIIYPLTKSTMLHASRLLLEDTGLYIMDLFVCSVYCERFKLVLVGRNFLIEYIQACKVYVLKYVGL